MLTSAKAAYVKTRRRMRDAASRPAGLSSEAGQAVIEYILLLVLVVGIIGGLLLKFNQAFGGYAKTLLGSYVICLLDNGELPALGGESGRSECAAPKFSFNAAAAGAAGAGGNGGGAGGRGAGGAGGAGNGSSKSGANRGGGDAANSQSGTKAADGVGGGTGRRGDTGFLSSGAGRARSTRLRSRDAEPASTSSTGKLEERKGSGGLNAGAPQGRERGGQVVAVFSPFDDGKNVDRDNARKVSLGAREERNLKPNKLPLQAQVRKVASVDAEESNFSLGNLLRYLLIAVILIVLVIFIGGQVLQATKSFDKN